MGVRERESARVLVSVPDNEAKRNAEIPRERTDSEAQQKRTSERS